MRLISCTKLHTCGESHIPFAKLCARLKKSSNRHHIAVVKVGIKKQEEMTGVSIDMKKITQFSAESSDGNLETPTCSILWKNFFLKISLKINVKQKLAIETA
jgi:hypothetical protein